MPRQRRLQAPRAAAGDATQRRRDDAAASTRWRGSPGRPAIRRSTPGPTAAAQPAIGCVLGACSFINAGQWTRSAIPSRPTPGSRGRGGALRTRRRRRRGRDVPRRQPSASTSGSQRSLRNPEHVRRRRRAARDCPALDEASGTRRPARVLARRSRHCGEQESSMRTGARPATDRRRHGRSLDDDPRATRAASSASASAGRRAPGACSVRWRRAGCRGTAVAAAAALPSASPRGRARARQRPWGELEPSRRLIAATRPTLRVAARRVAVGLRARRRRPARTPLVGRPRATTARASRLREPQRSRAQVATPKYFFSITGVIEILRRRSSP